jgi:hypothetical protein
MSGHQQEPTEPARHRPAPVRPEGESAPAQSPLASIAALQRQAGNGAVAGLFARSRPAQVQRQPLSARHAKDDSYRLHLDPQIEAQIRAINAMNAMIAPEPVKAGLLDLTLPPAPPTPGPPEASPPPIPSPPPPAPATPIGPAPGTGLMGPRAGTGGDVWKAILAEPSLGPAITALGDQAAAKAKTQWDQLSTGGAVAVVSGSIMVGGGAIAGILANPDARQWITSTLNDKIIPVPKVPGLAVQLNLSGENVIVGLHLDVGQVLPKALGFGPAAATTPLGTPFPEPVQRQVAVQPDRTCDHQHAPVIQRDPIPGGVGGATSAASGGAVGLQSIEGSFVIPGGKTLSGTLSREVRTTAATKVSVQIRSEQVYLSFSGPIYIDAQWPVQNMHLYSITHAFADNVTTSDVRLVDDELGDGFIDQTKTAQDSIAETVGQIIRRTIVDRARYIADPTREPIGGDKPTGQGPPPNFGRHEPPMPKSPPTDDRPSPYDPLKDPDPLGTVDALANNLKAMPSEGKSDKITSEEITGLTVGATIVVNKPVDKIEGGTGVHIDAGTAISLQVDSGASIPKLQGAGQGAAAIAAAADIKAIHASSSGLIVLKDNKPVASLDRVTVSRGGTVKIDHVTLLGEAADAARSERGMWALIGGVLGAEQLRENPLYSGDGISTEPVIVPGFVKGTLEDKLQEAFTDLLKNQGRTLIQGVDLGAVLGVPGGPPVKAP